jgi:hypothetical protein
MKTLFEQNGGTYSVVWDYILPDLILPPKKQSSFGKYGMLRKTYLKTNRKALYSQMIITGKLFDHLHEIDEQAHDMLELLMKHMTDLQGITEALTATDQMAWVGAMNNIKACAEEIVLSEVVYR